MKKKKEQGDLPKKSTKSYSILFAQIKAFITDLFMIYVPILYIMTYLVLGSAEKFRESQSGIFVCVFIYAIISSTLFSSKMQTPGYRYSRIILINLQNQPIGFFRAFFRFFVWIIGMTLVIGWLFPFFHPQKITFQDFVCQTRARNQTTQHYQRH